MPVKCKIIYTLRGRHTVIIISNEKKSILSEKSSEGCRHTYLRHYISTQDRRRLYLCNSRIYIIFFFVKLISLYHNV